MAKHVAGSPVSIGRPTPNNSVYILDKADLRTVPPGAIGVMWAGGAGVTRGYVGLEAKTRESYIPDPFADDGYGSLVETHVFCAKMLIVSVHTCIARATWAGGDKMATLRFWVAQTTRSRSRYVGAVSAQQGPFDRHVKSDNSRGSAWSWTACLRRWRPLRGWLEQPRC